MLFPFAAVMTFRGPRLFPQDYSRVALAESILVKASGSPRLVPHSRYSECKRSDPLIVGTTMLLKGIATLSQTPPRYYCFRWLILKGISTAPALLHNLKTGTGGFPSWLIEGFHLLSVEPPNHMITILFWLVCINRLGKRRHRGTSITHHMLMLIYGQGG